MDIREVLVPFSTPVRMPNGLQWFDNELFVMDQLTDDVFVLDVNGNVKRVITTDTQNGSGITVGGGFLWTASNGSPKARKEISLFRYAKEYPMDHENTRTTTGYT